MKSKPLLILGLIALGVFIWFWQQRPARHPEIKQVAQKVASAESPSYAPPPVSSLASSISRPVAGKATNQIKPEDISAAVRPILDTQESYLLRRDTVENLTTNLTLPERETVYQFLLQPGLYDQEAGEQALKNQLMDRLCELNPLPAGLDSVLIQMYQNKDQDIVLRDYAVQHLAAFYQQLEITGQINQPLRQKVQDSLWQALTESDSSIAGTALLTLTRLAEERQEFDQGRIRTAAIRLAGETDASELTRSAAMQISARLGAKEILPILMKTATQGEALPMRISAIGALGTLGAPEATSFLVAVVGGTEERLKTPARLALRKIEMKTRQAHAEINEK